MGEVTGRVVRTAGQHHRVDLLGLAAGEQPGAVGADAVPGEEGGGEGQVGAGGRDGALPEVLVEQDRHGVVDVAVGRHEVGECGVAVAVRGLGGGDLLVEVQGRVAALGSEEVEQFPGGVPGTGVEAVGDHERARVDERIPRDAVLVLQLHQRVERVAGGLAAHVLPECVALAGQVQGEREDLGDGLRGKRQPPVPHPVDRAVQLGHGHAETARIARRECRDVVGGPAASRGAIDLRHDPVEDRLELGGHDRHDAALLSTGRPGVVVRSSYAAVARRARRQSGML